MTHPLDKAINNATFGNPTPTPLECLPNNTPSEWLLDLTRAAAETFFPQTRRAHLRSIAIDTHNWLQTLGLPDPWQAMRDEYDRAKAKHGDRTLDSRLNHLQRIQNTHKYANDLQRFAEINYCAARAIDCAATEWNFETIRYLRYSAEMLWEWHTELSIYSDPDTLADLIRSEWNTTLQALNLGRPDKPQRIASDDYVYNATRLATAMRNIVGSLNDGNYLQGNIRNALAIVLDWWDYELGKAHQQ